MSNAENLIMEVARWVAKAEEDMRVAEHLMKIDNAPWSTVCFHAQQYAEKYLKGLLLWRGIAFPRTHDLGKLLTLFPESLALGWTPRGAAALTEHATCPALSR